MSLALLFVMPLVTPAGGESWCDAWTDNLRWAIDESARVVLDSDGKTAATFGFLGLDIHKVVSTDQRDVVTLTLQPYLTRVDSLNPTPPMFDGPDDWELVWRIFNANFKLRQDGALNVRVGHMEVPFGLEHVVNTNGTLRDYIHPMNFGLKADWGASLNGELDDFEYELAWTRGSGNEYRDEGNPGVVSGRLGTPRDADHAHGLSLLQGDFRTPAGIVERERVGLDTIHYYQDLGFLAEVSVGEDGGATDVARGLGEVNWRNRNETVFAWLQVIASELDGPGGDMNTLDSKLGLRWTPAQGWSVSVQYAQVIDPAASGGPRDGSLTLQLRYRF